jgi:hypothetical protein
MDGKTALVRHEWESGIPMLEISVGICIDRWYDTKSCVFMILLVALRHRSPKTSRVTSVTSVVLSSSISIS